jgi:hypothetical protein
VAREGVQDGDVKVYLALLVALPCAVPAVARAEVEFAGHMRTTRGEDRFVLTDVTAKKSSEWIGVGERFAGYRVTDFDEKGETLAVEKGGAIQQLRLKGTATAAGLKANAVAANQPIPPEELEAMRSEHTLVEAMQAKSHERDRLNARASELRGSLPEQHPSRQEVERKLTDIRQAMARDQVELDRRRRPALVKRIADSADDPVALARYKRELQSMDERQAKTGAK